MTTKKPSDETLIDVAYSIAVRFYRSHSEFNEQDIGDIKQQAFLILLEEQKHYDITKLTSAYTEASYLNWLGWRIKMRLQDWNRQRKITFRRSSNKNILLPGIYSLDMTIHKEQEGSDRVTTLHDIIGKEDVGYWFIEEVLSPPILPVKSRYGVIMGAGLTKRELEILYHLSLGLNRVEVGKTLYITEETVKTHLRNINFKLSAKNTLHSVAISFRSGDLN